MDTVPLDPLMGFHQIQLTLFSDKLSTDLVKTYQDLHLNLGIAFASLSAE